MNTVEDRRKLYFDLINLIRCSLYGQAPDVGGVDLRAVLNLALRHGVLVMAATPLSAVADSIDGELYAAIKNKAYEQAYRLSLLDSEREELLSYLNEQKIWHMPLKGVVLKELYPDPDMREMCDNDILYDSDRQAAVVEFFAARGYKGKIDASSDDVFTKPPVYNFEMHRSLFEDTCDSRWVQYYADVKSRLIPDDSGCGYHFSDEDFYIYVTLHNYKHYTVGGIGLRSVIDCAVYTGAKQLNWGYIERELAALGALDYSRALKGLADKLFGPAAALLDEAEADMLDYIMSSGAYGTLQHFVENGSGEGRRGYLWRRLFPGLDWFKTYRPFFYRHRLLIPFYYLYRFGRAAVNAGRIKKEFDYLNKKDRE